MLLLSLIVIMLYRFADREFYSDWWNATSMDVFSRKWNKPVHNFLLRHVYASSISVGASKSAAMFVTFLLSSLLHELVMAIVSGKIRGYLFMMQMAQMPLILLGQIPFIKQNEGLGNLIFWIGLLVSISASRRMELELIRCLLLPSDGLPSSQHPLHFILSTSVYLTNKSS